MTITVCTEQRPMDRERYPLLSRIPTPDLLRQLPESELPAVAGELRDYLIETVSQVGGHFGAGLGVIGLGCWTPILSS